MNEFWWSALDDLHLFFSSNCQRQSTAEEEHTEYMILLNIFECVRLVWCVFVCAIGNINLEDNAPHSCTVISQYCWRNEETETEEKGNMYWHQRSTSNMQQTQIVIHTDDRVWKCRLDSFVMHSSRCVAAVTVDGFYDCITCIFGYTRLADRQIFHVIRVLSVCILYINVRRSVDGVTFVL